MLESAGLAGRFEVVVTSEDVAEPKPAEDSPPGAAAARAAGMYVIAVPYFPDLPLEADLVADSLASPAIGAALLGPHRPG